MERSNILLYQPAALQTFGNCLFEDFFFIKKEAEMESLHVTKKNKRERNKC